MRRLGIAWLALAATAGTVHAAPATLVLRELPAPATPRSLAIARRAPRATAPPRTTAPPRLPSRDTAPPVSRADAPVRVRVELGFAVDGARPTQQPTLAGGDLDGYQAIRPFATGAAFLSTHGLVAAPLTTYLALGFRLAPAITSVAPLAASLDRTRDVQLRAAWGDVDRTIDDGRLGALHLRAGRLYNYATWPLHVDGLDATWAGGGIQVEALAGYRVDEFQSSASRDHAPIGALGLRLAIDLGARRLIPTTVSAAVLRLGPRTIATLAVDHRLTDRATARADVRIIDGAATHEALLLRAQLGDQLHVAVDVINQASTDWRFGPSFVSASDPGAPRAYLEFAAPAPNVTLTARTGVVLLGNVDLLGRIGAGVTRADTDDLHAADWIEGGLAAEVRARRTIAVGASVLMRDTDRADRDADVDVDGPQPLDLRGSGDESFLEAGASARLNLGLRRLSTSLEVYGRRIRYATRYVEPGAATADPEALPAEWRAGGRVAIDAWMTPRVRARIGYDLSTTLDVAPEIAGYKSLRLTLEGSFD